MSLDIYFPLMKDVSEIIEPLDDRVLLQLQFQPKYNGLIQLTDTDQESSQFQRTLCKVISYGANAFVSKQTGRRWVDVQVGDYVIAPKLDGKRMLVKHPVSSDQQIHLLLVEDCSVLVKIHDPKKYLNILVNKG